MSSRSDRDPDDEEREGALGRLTLFLSTPIGRRLAKALLAVTVVLAAGVVVRHARAQAYRMPAHRLGPATLRLVDLPDWVDPGMRAALHDPRLLPFGVSLFDPGAEAVVREAVARHPMVREVRRVVIEYPHSVEAAVRVRTPVAWVRVPGGYALLSDDRRVLDPRPYASYLQRLRVPMPVVTGIRARPPRAGQAWEDRREQVAEAVEAARTAARIYRDLRGRVIVKEVDVSRFPARPEDRTEGEVRMVLADGRVVEWGRTERDLGDTGEDGYGYKVRRLEAWLDDPRPSNRARIDVRYRMSFEISSER